MIAVTTLGLVCVRLLVGMAVQVVHEDMHRQRHAEECEDDEGDDASSRSIHEVQDDAGDDSIEIPERPCTSPFALRHPQLVSSRSA